MPESQNNNMKDLFHIKISPEVEAALIERIKRTPEATPENLEVPAEGSGSGAAFFGINECCDFF